MLIYQRVRSWGFSGSQFFSFGGTVASVEDELSPVTPAITIVQPTGGEGASHPPSEQPGGLSLKSMEV
jgi:hypothetical protein